MSSDGETLLPTPPAALAALAAAVAPGPRATTAEDSHLGLDGQGRGPEPSSRHQSARPEQ